MTANITTLCAQLHAMLEAEATAPDEKHADIRLYVCPEGDLKALLDAKGGKVMVLIQEVPEPLLHEIEAAK